MSSGGAEPSARSTPPTPVGFIGLGMMGSRVAANLQRAGYPLVVHNRTRARAEPAIAAGAVWAESPVEVGRRVGAGVLMTMMTDRRALDAVLFGRTGASKGLRPGALVVDLTTIAPGESRAVSERLGARGIHMVDAPVGGSIDAAELHTLLLYVGGEAPDVARAQPMLEVIGRRWEHFGPVGSGSAAKIVNNLLTTSTMALLGEGLALGDAFGLDRPHLLAVLGLGGASSKVLEAKQGNLLRREYPTQFKLSLARKDIRLAERAARESGLELGIVRAVRREYDRSAGLGHADEDYSAVVTVAGKRDPPRPSIRDPPSL